MSTIKRTWIKVKRKLLRLKPGSMFATFNRGKYVDVTRTVDGRIFIKSHKAYPGAPKGTIILIPYQPNHGVMVEFIDENGQSKWRDHMDYQMFYKSHATQEETTHGN